MAAVGAVQRAPTKYETNRESSQKRKTDHGAVALSPASTHRKMRVPFDKVKSLRDRTGQPLQRCKEALASTGCDLDAAERWLQGGEAIPAPAARPTPAALPTPALQPEPVESARPNGFTPPSSERNSVDDGVLDGFMSFATPPSGFGAGGSSPFAGMLAAPAPAPASDGMGGHREAPAGPYYTVTFRSGGVRDVDELEEPTPEAMARAMEQMRRELESMQARSPEATHEIAVRHEIAPRSP
ncbi:hypothetical protein EMIHUDRAFT_237655 [Emiliania huxleyi CCMP1516]|uniref:UBA domain-containing protein n=2 Tax=Emiliania huxleyi TaxID=2903 RepID=A0A0D3JPL0_EMIH1|nr:hypothetical protein EMIHUDRAFT_237655 [Emiliania huxleyi CCMP1516]EOD25445.1 hypothetical protein EMIHUDRAFT_237655 [Emiliania huxleyi CCMP1516]|eukprot:XP_005777874.1 hypothetical protein EMIHUDRAFT_237655 [Emiliania huxleyi CCMP1516]